MMLSSRFSISRLFQAVKEKYISPWLFYLRMRVPFFAFKSRVRAAGTKIEEDFFRLRNVYRVQRGKPGPGERYIVCADINDLLSGLGCCLFILGPCWKYALKTGRTLIIDWRGNPYTRKDPEKNLFSLLFEQPDPSEIGVSCIADDSINDFQIPQPVLGPAEAILQESGAVDKLPVGGLDKRDMRKLIASCVDVDFPTIMPSLRTTFFLASRVGPMGLRRPPMFSFQEAQRLYQSLKLRPQWAAMVSDFYHAHMAAQPVIGVHVRHGNGEGKNRDHFRRREIQDFASFVESLTDKIRRYASSRFGKKYTVFLCTDSNDVVNAMKPCFTLLVSRPIWRPAPGEGVDFDHAYKRSDGGVGAAVDALIDMQLLAKCDVVLMTRWTAFASHVPYILEKPGAVFFDYEQTAKI